MGLRQLTAPAEPPLDLAAAKEHLRLEDELVEDDALVEALVLAATDAAEEFLNRALISQQWELSLDTFPYPYGAIVLPLGRTISVDSIEYEDTDGNTQTLSTDDYQVELTRDSRNRIVPEPDETWPSTEAGRLGAVRVTFTAGYGAAREDVPTAIVAGIKLILGHLYENRETVLVGVTAAELPLGAEAVLSLKRLVPV